MRKPKTFQEVLGAWAVDTPPDMQGEPLHDQLLDSFLRLFESLSAAGIQQLPARPELFRAISRAMHWQWIALGFPSPPWLGNLAPATLTLLIIRWLMIWKTDREPGQPRLMAAIDKDLGRLRGAAQYVVGPRKD